MKKILVVCIFNLAFLILNSSAQDPRKDYGWAFTNYTTPILFWDIYANSFFAIPPTDSSGLTAPLDLLFYNLGFKTVLAANGNCFGLSLQAIVMNKDGGNLGYCCPVNFYGGSGTTGPSDPKLARVINIMHGRQMTTSSLQEIFDQFLDGHSNMASYGVSHIKTLLTQEGPCIVSITKSLSPSDGGHSMIAYKVDGPAGSEKIWVIDPNRIWADSITNGQRNWYTSNSNFIQISGAGGNQWSFDMADTVLGFGAWTNSDGEGNLIGMSAVAQSVPGRVPTSFGLAVGDLLERVFISNNDGGHGATIVQVRNSEGKQLFKNETTKELDWNPATGMRTMMPFFPSNGNGKIIPFEIYYNLKGNLRDAEVTFTTGSKGVTLAVGDNPGFITFKTEEADVRVTLEVHGIGSSSPSVTVKEVSKPLACDLELLVAMPRPTGTNRIFSLNALRLLPGDTTSMTVEHANYATLSSHSTDPVFLEIRQESKSSDHNFVSLPIPLIAHDALKVDMRQWVQKKLVTGKKP
jgi:hypothetical protein